jgi:hypothetical protein
MATITYSQIQFITQVSPLNYNNQLIPIRILVGTNQALCSPGPCTYTWAQSATPSLTSVSPTSINGPQTLTLTGQNFAPTGSISASAVSVTVNGQPCNVSTATNSTITCNIGSVQAGSYSISVSISGITLFNYNRICNVVVFSIDRCWNSSIILDSYISCSYFQCFTNTRQYLRWCSFDNQW